MARQIDATGLQRGFGGKTIVPGDGEYDAARAIFNSMIDRRPAVIAQPASVSDVAAAIRFARDNDLEIAVRSGGHSVAGASVVDDGLVIDMRQMNEVTVDTDNDVARVGGGANWGNFDTATQAFGLGATGGRVSSTGVAGLTLGGGSGWVERKFGLACDNLLAVELVTAEGEHVRASEDENADLFLALHGGGGNFGVATAFEFRLRALGPEIYVTLQLYPREQAPEIARFYRDFAESAPDEIGGGLAFLTAPPEEFVPAELQGTVMCGMIGTWCGPIEDAEKALGPLLNYGEPAVKIAMPVAYTMFQSMLDDPPGFRNYWTAEYMDSLPDDAIDVFCEWGMKQTPSPTQLILLPWGGAVARVGEDDTPMTKRQSPWVFHPLSLWEGAENDDFWISWARGSAEAMRRFTSGGVYLNFVGDEGQDRIVAAFGKAKYERLAMIKGRYDPQNVFHLNPNIKPLSTPAGVS
ncbi:MAG: FAD-binding oxidoreductase [Actinomycetota bacterium]